MDSRSSWESSSLKDALCLKSMGYNIEVIAPDSENTMIPESTINKLSKNYKSIIVLFDNDEPGIRASAKHSKLYLAEEMCIPTTAGVKDPSDFVDKYNYDKLLKQIL